MFLPEKRYKIAIRAISMPFAFASSALVFALAMLEYFRRGFVSLFFDLRIAAGAALAFWIAAALSRSADDKPSAAEAVACALAALAAAALLYRSALPYGRLGLAAFAIGALAAVLTALSFFFSEKPKN